MIHISKKICTYTEVDVQSANALDILLRKIERARGYILFQPGYVGTLGNDCDPALGRPAKENLARSCVVETYQMKRVFNNNRFRLLFWCFSASLVVTSWVKRLLPSPLSMPSSMYPRRAKRLRNVFSEYECKNTLRSEGGVRSHGNPKIPSKIH